MDAVDFFKYGVAFVPSNEADLGDVIVTYGKNGECDIEKISARSYLSQLARYFGVDLRFLRTRYGQAISKKQMIPLPFAPEWTLVPVQVRLPVGRQQTYGWLVMQAIERIESDDREHADVKLKIHVKGGHIIPVRHSYEDFRRILREVQLVELHYQILHQTPDWVKESKSKYLYLL